MRTQVLTLIVGCSLAALGPPAFAQSEPAAPLPMRAYVPSTISPEAAAIYARYKPLILSPTPKPPQSAADFEAMRQGAEKGVEARVAAAIQQSGATVAEHQMGGVPVLEIRPKGYKDDGSVLIFVHGGGFVTGSARSSLLDAIPMAEATGRRVISVDYTVAPKGRWSLATDQVTSVYKAVLATGAKPARIGVFGGSAGGTISAAATLKIRDRGLPLPAALLLISPMSDLTDGSDTRVTLADADPALRQSTVRPGLDAYADPADQKNPYVSPVYGDFNKGYPPTLIQGGTKEWLVSDFVRLHRAIRRAGGDSRLELYEGMPHGFPIIMAGAPEGREAMAEEVAFWKQHLSGGKPR